MVPLYAGPDQTLVPAAQLQPDGRITGATPLKPGRTETLQSILSMGGWVGGLCVMDGLKAAASINVVLPESTYFFVRLSDLQQQMQPLTSPPVPAGRVLSHDLQAYDQQFALAMSQLVYVPEDVTVQGEQRCLRGFEQSNSISVNQNSIQVNLKLTRGWNALVRLNTSTDKQNNGAGILLSDTVWRTVPHEAIERWK
ncbi:hypothetical protein [Deinococcus humi]|uniref:Uncharacterized protein n=1 Tax=Deinococcus humi TaxID=662880 RepID=A0A7W8JTH1_9DEIO|nr:hypothetical protein [Deinococcus humi]MBB5362498.1 hypothetical protein [Deinococcus humi]